MIKTEATAWYEQTALNKMMTTDDVFRGFVTSPDGSVELEVEIFLTTSGKLEVSVFDVEKDKLLTLNESDAIGFDIDPWGDRNE